MYQRTSGEMGAVVDLGICLFVPETIDVSLSWRGSRRHLTMIGCVQYGLRVQFLYNSAD